MTNLPTSIPGEFRVCPRCGDPLTTGCRPAAGICVLDPYEEHTVRIAPGMSALTDEEWAVVTAQYDTDEPCGVCQGRGCPDCLAANPSTREPS